jgi:hypothetical protein
MACWLKTEAREIRTTVCSTPEKLKKRINKYHLAKRKKKQKKTKKQQNNNIITE